MARKGYRKYACDECKAESMIHWIERNRASGLKCPACGSRRVELVSKEARDDQASLNEVAIDGHRDMTIPLHKLDKNRTVVHE